MDGENDGAMQGKGGAAQSGTQTQADARMPVGNAGGDGDGMGVVPPAPKAPKVKAADDYEAAIKERDEQIEKLQAQIADAAKNAETAEKLADQITELKEQAESERIEFELKLAGCRNVKAARAILDEHDGSVDALKDAEPWLFDDGKAATSQPKGKTGLNPAGASGKDDSTMKRWRKLAGLED